MILFKKLYAKYYFESIKDSLLLFTASAAILFTVFSLINLFIVNIEMPVLWILILSIIAPLVFILFFRGGAKKCIENLNEWNREQKNYLYTIYETAMKKEKNRIEGMLLESSEETEKRIKVFYSMKSRINIFRTAYISIFVFLLFLLFFPVLFSNIMNLTYKSAVLVPRRERVELISFNYGGASGRYYVKVNDKVKFYSPSDTSQNEGFIFFKGPGVVSNEISLYLLKELKPDSVKIEIVPPLYQKRPALNVHIASVKNIPEYSSVSVFPYFSRKVNSRYEVGEYEKGIGEKFLKIIVSYISSADTYDIKIEKDESPICKLLYNGTVNGEDFEYIDVPFAALDDYGLDYTGVMVKNEADSTELRFPKSADSIYVFRLIPENMVKGRTVIRAFAKDDNPYRIQRTYSEPFIIEKEGSSWEVSGGSDSLSSFEGYKEEAEKIAEKLEKMRNEYIASKEKSVLTDMERAMDEIKRMSDAVREEMKSKTNMNLPQEILEKMLQIKKKVDALDEETREKLRKDIEDAYREQMDFAKAAEKISKESKEIERSLEELSKMLDQLKKLGDLNSLKKALEKTEEVQKTAMEESESREENQSKVTQMSQEMEKMSKENENLSEYSKELNNLTKMSKSAEKKPEKSEDVKKGISELKKKVEQSMKSMTKEQLYSPEEMIAVFYSAEQVLQSGKGSIGQIYKDALNYISALGASNDPLAAMIKNGIEMSKTAGIEEMRNYNYRIIAALLTPQQSGGKGGGVSMDEMMEQMQKMGQKQMQISDALTEMFENAMRDMNAMNELAKIEKEIYSQMKKLSEKSGGEYEELTGMGDSLKDIGERLERGELSEELLDKEHRVMNRMLHFTRSLYKQGINEKRESEVGIDERSGIKILVPDDLGNRKYGIEKQLMENLRMYKNPEYKKKVYDYYMELLK